MNKIKAEDFSNVVAIMELCLQLEGEQQRILAAFPQMGEQFSASIKGAQDEATAKANALESRIKEVTALLETRFAAIGLEHTSLREAFDKRKREFATFERETKETVPAPVRQHISELFAAITIPDGKPGEPGKPGAPGKDGSMASKFRGNWSKEAVYHTDDIFTFRGSSYLVLQDCRAVLPTVESQKGGSAVYGLLAASGAPGLPGQGADGGGGGSASWGGITGTLSNQTDLQTALNAKQATISFGTGVQTALGVNVGSAGAPVLFDGAGGTPSSIALTNATGLPASAITGLGTGVATALAVNVGSAGAFITFNGDAGTPSAAVLTNATGLPITTGVSGLGTGIAGALAVNVGSAGAPILFNAAGGTPSSMVGTNITGTAAGLTAGAATAASTVATTATTTAANFYPLFVPATANGNQAAALATAYTFNPNTGAMSISGNLTTGSGASTAGAIVLTQGTTQSTGTTNITLQAPAAVTSHIYTYPGTVGTNGAFWTQTTSGTTATLLNTKVVPAGTVVGTTDTQVLTNKTVQPRITALTSSATPTYNVDSCDVVNITALAAAITSMTSSRSGTPYDFQQLEFRIKDDGTARAITWGADFANGLATLPGTTILGKTLYVYAEFDTVTGDYMCQSSGSYP